MMAHRPDSLSFSCLHHLTTKTCSSANVYWQTTTKLNVKCENKSSYLLAEQFRQNTGRFKFDIFKLGDLLRYKPLQSIRFKTKQNKNVSFVILPLFAVSTGQLQR